MKTTTLGVCRGVSVAVALPWVLLWLSSSVHAFVPTHQRTAAFAGPGTTHSKTTTTTTTDTLPSAKTTARSMMGGAGWEDLVYGAQSVASSWASVSLEDPSNLVTSLPIMYGAGLLTSFSPCVWGLLPLTMSYISTAAGEREDQQTTLPTIAFAAGLAVVFCTLGVTAAELGGVFGSTTTGSSAGGDAFSLMALLSNAIVVIMGLQLLELIRVPLPSLDALRNAINPLTPTPSSSSSSSDEPILLDGTGKILATSTSETQKRSKEKGSLFRTFLLGGSSALVASPCATPVLTSILAFVAKSQSPVLGGTLLLGYTLGYSTPLLLLASTGGQALVDLKQGNKGGGLYGKIAPWVTPITAGILLWYGTNGVLTALLGDPSLAGLMVLE